ncbi:MAG: phenylacetate--CoA ligase family protein [Thermomicrobiales bacterium]
MNAPLYLQLVDAEKLLAEFPIGQRFLKAWRAIGPDELRQRQERMFRLCVARAWTTPFYRRLWGERGIEPGDIRGLDNLARLPSFDKQDIMASLERAPPFGDFSGRDAYPPGERPPVIIHTTSGTTGQPQVVPFGPRGREVQNLLLARAYLLHGITDQDVVHSVYGHGLINGGHYIREAVTHWTGATFLSVGTGIETRSMRQVELMQRFGATTIVGFVDYIKHLAGVAREAGLVPGRDIPLRRICGHIGPEDRAALSASWGGPEIFDWYGVADTGIIASEGPDHEGLHVWEDAHLLEIRDVESGAAVPEGGTGDMVVTVLFKDDIYPMIRFNTHDVTRWRPGSSALGLPFRRIEGFLGRSDNMVKLRGINVFPQAVGAVLAADEAFAGEYVCRLDRDPSGRDDLTVLVEVRDDPGRGTARERFRDRLRTALGVDVGVELARPGELAELTGITSRQKPLRLIDARQIGRPAS